MTPVIGSNRPRAASTRAILRELDPSGFKASAHQEDHQSHVHGDGDGDGDDRRQCEYRNSNQNQNQNHHDALALTHSPTNASTDSTGTSTSIPSITISSSSDSSRPLGPLEVPPNQPSEQLSSSVSLPEEDANEHREEIQQARQQNATQTSSPSSSSSPAGVRLGPTGTLSRAVASAGANTSTTATRLTGLTGTTGAIPTVDQCAIRPERVSNLTTNPCLALVLFFPHTGCYGASTAYGVRATAYGALAPSGYSPSSLPPAIDHHHHQKVLSFVPVPVSIRASFFIHLHLWSLILVHNFNLARYQHMSITFSLQLSTADAHSDFRLTQSFVLLASILLLSLLRPTMSLSSVHL